MISFIFFNQSDENTSVLLVSMETKVTGFSLRSFASNSFGFIDSSYRLFFTGFYRVSKNSLWKIQFWSPFYWFFFFCFSKSSFANATFVFIESISFAERRNPFCFLFIYFFFWVSEFCWFLLHRFYTAPLSRYRCVASYRTSHWSVSADAATRIWPRFLIFMFFINLPSFFKNNFVFASASRTPGLTMGDRINTRPRFYVFFLLFLPKKREIKKFYSFVVAAVVAVVAAVVVRFAHFRP